MQTAPIEQSLRPFFPAALDDAGLTLSEYRVFGHLCRRAGGGLAWCSVPSIAKHCRISEKTAWKSLKSLNARRMILRTSRPGMTNHWSITSSDQWILGRSEDNPPESRGRVHKPAPTVKETVGTHGKGDGTKGIQLKGTHCTSVAVGVSVPQVEPGKAAAAPEPVRKCPDVSGQIRTPSPDMTFEERCFFEREDVLAAISRHPDKNGKLVVKKLWKQCEKEGVEPSIERLNLWLQREWKPLAVKFNGHGKPELEQYLKSLKAQHPEFV